MSTADSALAALLQAGVEHHRAGRLPEAEACYRQMLERAPGHPEAQYRLGLIALQVGRLDIAIELIGRAAQLAPEASHIQINLGEAHRRNGQPALAEAAFRRALAFEPENAFVHNNLGIIYSDAGRTDIAIACFQKALELAPDFAEALNNLSDIWRATGQLDSAIAGFQRAHELQPEQVSILINLATAWAEAGCVENSFACWQRAVKMDPQSAALHSTSLYASLFLPEFDAPALLRAHRMWDQKHAAPLAPAPHVRPGAAEAERRLRIGYVSPHFSDHVVGRNVLPLIQQHDRASFEIYCYADLKKSDAFTERFRAAADRFREITGQPAERVAQLIRDDGIDLLVDLTLHMGDNRLLVFARKPAPVQVTFAGYPGTTGLTAIDYRLTDPYLDPPGENDAHYTEKSIRLPASFWCYVPTGEEPAVEPLPATSRGSVTFGCLSYAGKLSRDSLSLWALVLHALPDSRLVLLAPEGPGRRRITSALAGEGIAAERVEFIPRLSRADYLAQYQRIDVDLDPLPYNGHTTSLDALWMGVPVVTLVGRTVVGRAGLSQLSNLGLADLVARTPDEFVRVAVALASDRPRLASLRMTLRDRMACSPLTDVVAFTRGIETAYREMWRQWCESLAGQTE